MSAKFIDYDQSTLYLLPPSLQDWLPDDHLARFVVEIVDQLDLSSLKAAYAGRGSQPYNPEMLLALLFYGYATGVFSSRKLERSTYDSVAFRFIAANAHPDHDTIAVFRKRFLPELKALFVQILLIAGVLYIIDLFLPWQRVCIDLGLDLPGTCASASGGSARRTASVESRTGSTPRTTVSVASSRHSRRMRWRTAGLGRATAARRLPQGSTTVTRSATPPSSAGSSSTAART